MRIFVTSLWREKLKYKLSLYSKMMAIIIKLKGVYAFG